MALLRYTSISISLLLLILTSQLFSQSIEEFLGFTPISLSRIQNGAVIYISGNHFEHLVDKEYINVVKSNQPLVIITGYTAKNLSAMIDTDLILREIVYISALHDTFVVVSGDMAERMFRTVEMFAPMDRVNQVFSSRNLSIILENEDFSLGYSLFNFFKEETNALSRLKMPVHIMGFNQEAEIQILKYIISVLSNELALSSSIIFLRSHIKRSFLNEFNLNQNNNERNAEPNLGVRQDVLNYPQKKEYLDDKGAKERDDDWIALVVGKISKEIYKKSPFAYLNIDYTPSMVQVFYKELSIKLFQYLASQYPALRVGTFSQVIVTGSSILPLLSEIEERYHNSKYGRDFMIVNEAKFNRLTTYFSTNFPHELVYLVANFIGESAFTLCDTLDNVSKLYEGSNNLFYSTKSIYFYPKGNILELDIGY